MKLTNFPARISLHTPCSPVIESYERHDPALILLASLKIKKSVNKKFS